MLPLPNLETLYADFCDVLGVVWKLPADLRAIADATLTSLGETPPVAADARRNSLIALVNSKFRVNAGPIADFLAAAAERRQPLHYHDKQAVQSSFDTSDRERLRRLLVARNYDLSLLNFFRPVAPEETLELLRARMEGESGIVDSVLRSLFGGYFYSSFPARKMHELFNSECRQQYHGEFFDHLRSFYADALHRDCALIFLNIDEHLRGNASGTQLRDALCSFIEDAYDRLGNHCTFAVLIEPFPEGGESGQWRLFADLVLFAEKFREVAINTGYFHPNKIAAETARHIETLDQERAAFDLANEGFFFKDCFILEPTSLRMKETESIEPYDLLLLFEKNERDERVIPCPACRTVNVRGNSYPVLGVKSWECQNPLCPERSAFDRGNRYSLASLIKQEAIRGEENQIPEESIRRWKLDLVPCDGIDQVADMLLRHFSLFGDSVLFVNVTSLGEVLYGRKVAYTEFEQKCAEQGRHSRFRNSSFFHRYLLERPASPPTPPPKVPTGIEGMELIQGDCVEVLRELNEASFDGAVTSPPYYNARSYFQWSNIYCFLYDMFNMATAVFRVLKPGSVFLFNIFDYFDNENNLVFSAMGKKRMILGAYILDLFKRAGFHLEGNVIWDKGEIEGKRAFNQGNCSPYYQLPLNCWEHIFVFRKPGTPKRAYQFPSILTMAPVRKFLGGQNLHGHSAPFPDGLPRLLIAQMNKGECVLDPYSGSMTTGRVAHEHGVKSISIELHKEYCDLSIQLAHRDDVQPGLFDNSENGLNGKGNRKNGVRPKRLNSRLGV